MKNSDLKTKKDIALDLKIPINCVNWLIRKFGIEKVKKKGRYNLYDIRQFYHELEKIKQTRYSDLISDILNLYKKYDDYKISFPQGLKGDIGELLVMEQLIQQFANESIILLGGAQPGFDILLKNKRIQVKTYCNLPERIKENIDHYGCNIEKCPTIREKNKGKYDFIILVEVYFIDDYQLDRKKTSFYIFNKIDSENFLTDGCYTGKTKKDKTIWHVLKPITDQKKEGLGNKVIKDIEAFDKDEYRKLFKSAKDNWQKLI